MKVAVSIQINNLSTLTFDPLRANTGFAISENNNKHVTIRKLKAFS